MATAGAMRVLEKRLQQEAAAAATVPESPPPGTPGTGELGGVEGWLGHRSRARERCECERATKAQRV